MSCGLGTRLMVNKLTMIFSKKVKGKEKKRENMKEVETEKGEEMEGEETTKGEEENVKLEGKEGEEKGEEVRE